MNYFYYIVILSFIFTLFLSNGTNATRKGKEIIISDNNNINNMNNNNNIKLRPIENWQGYTFSMVRMAFNLFSYNYLSTTLINYICQSFIKSEKFHIQGTNFINNKDNNIDATEINFKHLLGYENNYILFRKVTLIDNKKLPSYIYKDINPINPTVLNISGIVKDVHLMIDLDIISSKYKNPLFRPKEMMYSERKIRKAKRIKNRRFLTDTNDNNDKSYKSYFCKNAGKISTALSLVYSLAKRAFSTVFNNLLNILRKPSYNTSNGVIPLELAYLERTQNHFFNSEKKRKNFQTDPSGLPNVASTSQIQNVDEGDRNRDGDGSNHDIPLYFKKIGSIRVNVSIGALNNFDILTDIKMYKAGNGIIGRLYSGVMGLAKAAKDFFYGKLTKDIFDLFDDISVVNVNFMMHELTFKLDHATLENNIKEERTNEEFIEAIEDQILTQKKFNLLIKHKLCLAIKASLNRFIITNFDQGIFPKTHEKYSNNVNVI